MTGHGAKLPRKQEQTIAALLSCSTVAAAAQAVGIGEKTLWRWLQRPDFQAVYREARHAAMNQAVSRLQAASSEAVATLQSIISDKSPLTPASAKVSAARCILEMSLRVSELEDIESRLERMEYLATGLLNAQRQRHGGRHGYANQTYEER